MNNKDYSKQPYISITNNNYNINVFYKCKYPVVNT